MCVICVCVICVLCDVCVYCVQVNPKSRHIPYRDSMLTYLLSDSLGGNSKTVMVANIVRRRGEREGGRERQGKGREEREGGREGRSHSSYCGLCGLMVANIVRRRGGRETLIVLLLLCHVIDCLVIANWLIWLI